MKADGVYLVSAFPVRIANERAYVLKPGMPEFDAGDICNLRAQTTNWDYSGMKVVDVSTTTIRGMGKDVMALMGVNGMGKLQRSMSQYSGYAVDLDETLTFYALAFQDDSQDNPCGCGEKTAEPEETSFVTDEVSVVVSNMEMHDPEDDAEDEEVIWDEEDEDYEDDDYPDEIELEELVEDRFKDLIDPDDL